MNPINTFANTIQSQENVYTIQSQENVYTIQS